MLIVLPEAPGQFFFSREKSVPTRENFRFYTRENLALPVKKSLNPPVKNNLLP